ncbi:MAG: cysteine--tRNA ligase, partial [Clostridia bacterium]|nr:cysteine--tRNA ligase [Clostridia bacterium]
AYLGHPWCNYWFHILHLNTSSGKMSKSKGEFLTVSLLEEKGYDPIVYRFFCLQSHYRKSLVFSWEGLDNAVTAYDKLIARIAALDPEDKSSADGEAENALRATFREAMDNDLNTSLAITALYDVLKAPISDGAKLTLLGEFDAVLSLNLLSAADKKREETAAPKADSNLTAKIEEMIAERAAAKKAKDYARADAIRAELTAMGVTLKDTPNGTEYTIG